MKTKRGLALILGGLLLIAAALGLTAYNLWDDHRVRERSNAALTELEGYVPAPTAAPKVVENELPVYPDYVLNPDMPMPTRSVNGMAYSAILRIPALDLELPVLADDNYELLVYAPGCYRGSIYSHDLVICAHNYQAHFGRIYTLSPGDEVTLTDMEGNVFRYQVTEQELLGPLEIDRMIHSDWDLTLYTCTVGGQNRVTVRCDLVD